MKKLLALMLCLLMCLSLTVGLTACGGEYPEDSAVVTDEEAKELIIGDWTGNVIMPEIMVDELEAELGDMEEYVDLSTLTLEVSLRFANGGKGEMTMSKDAVKELAEKVLDLVCDGAVKYIREKLDVTDDEWAEYLDSVGMTEQELVDSVLEKIKAENLTEELADELKSTEFFYKIDSGKLYISDTRQFAEDDAVEYKLTDKALYIVTEEAAVKFERK